MERRFSEQLLIQGHELHASVEVQLFKKPAKIIFVVLVKIHNFEQYYTCNSKPNTTKGCSTTEGDDYTCNQCNANEY